MRYIAFAFAFLAIVAFNNAPALAASSSCTLATDAEVSAAIGKPLGSPTPTGPLNSACQWSSPSDQEAYVQIQKVSKRDWNPEKLVPGYRKINGIGQAAFVVPELGGWKACGLQGEVVVCASVNGGRASANAASTLLMTSLKRASG